MVVIIDDKSTDNSLDIIQQLISSNKYKNSIKTIHLLQNEENLKQSKTRNKAIKHIWKNVDIFGVLDMDDLYLPGKLSKSIEIMNSAPQSIGLVYSDVLIRDERNGRVVYEAREPFSRRRVEQECIISNSPIINKVAFDKVGLYDEDLTPCEDWDLWMRITEQMLAIHIPEALQLYSVTGLNCSFTLSKEIWQKNWDLVFKKMMARRHA